MDMLGSDGGNAGLFLEGEMVPKFSEESGPKGLGAMGAEVSLGSFAPDAPEDLVDGRRLGFDGIAAFGSVGVDDPGNGGGFVALQGGAHPANGRVDAGHPLLPDHSLL